MIPSKETPAKLPYRKPRLVVYGAVRELTGRIGTRGASGDGATKGLNKTS